ncbi:hypothetical protein ACFQEX_02530 [Roseibium salinum]|uniref:hypothetical protein n=1 Tax=Roseibium salinum TaxID=1604349 RepID=UPI00360E9721
MISQNSERAAEAAPDEDVRREQPASPDEARSRPEGARSSRPSGSSFDGDPRSETDDAGPVIGPGRRATDGPLSAPARVLQHLALAGLVLGLGAALFLVTTDGLNRFLGAGLAFFAGGLAVWRLFADDMFRAVQAVQIKDERSGACWRDARNWKTVHGNSASPTSAMPASWQRSGTSSSGATRTASSLTSIPPRPMSSAQIIRCSPAVQWSCR